MTKKEARARRAAWTAALESGRVVRNGDGMSFTSFATTELASAEVAKQIAAGLNAEIVKV